MERKPGVNRGEQMTFFPRANKEQERLWSKLPLRARQECILLAEDMHTLISGAPKVRVDFTLDKDRDFAVIFRDLWLMGRKPKRKVELPRMSAYGRRF